MQQSQRAYRVRGRIDDKLRPLCSARVGESESVHTAGGNRGGKLFHFRKGSVGGLEGAKPGVAGNVETDMAGFNDVTGRECGSTNHIADVLGNDLLIADAVLH